MSEETRSPATLGVDDSLARVSAPVIFLDIDGVMNNTGEGSGCGVVPWLEPSNVAILNQIVQATGAVVVITSSWRLSASLAELRDGFHAAGCIAELIDVTPAIDGPRRGREICAWLEAQVDPPTRYVAIDDLFDMPELPGKLVKTRQSAGLTAGELPQILAYLAG